jgi:hypothetical protein
MLYYFHICFCFHPHHIFFTRPLQIIAEGDMRKFHAGLRRGLLPQYMACTEQAAMACLQALPESGTFEVFAHMKTLMHRVGLQCWAGPEATESPHFERLTAAFEVCWSGWGWRGIVAGDGWWA